MGARARSGCLQRHPAMNGQAARRHLGMLSLILLCLALTAAVLLVVPPAAQQTGALAALSLTVGALILIKAPEAALTLLLFAGEFKASPLFAPLSNSIDLTLCAALLTIPAMAKVVLIERRPVRVHSTLLIIWLALCALLLASLLWTRSASYGMLKASQFVTLSSITFFAPIVLFSASTAPLRRFLYSLLAFATAYSLAALPQGLATRTQFGFVFIPGANYLALGRVASTGVVVALAYVLPHGGRRTILGVATIAIAAAALLFSGGRGPLLALAASLLVLAAAGRRALGSLGRQIALLVTLLIVVFAIVVLLGLMPETIRYRLSLLNLTDIAQDTSTGMRLRYWQSAWDALSAHPLLGLGSGGFAQWFWGHDMRDYPHNILLEAGAELGVCGLGLLLALFALPCTMWWSGSRRPTTLEHGLLRITVLGLFVLCWANAMVSGDLNDNRMALMSSALMLTCCGLPPRHEEARGGSRP